jgi:hypothetical protein
MTQKPIFYNQATNMELDQKLGFSVNITNGGMK